MDTSLDLDLDLNLSYSAFQTENKDDPFSFFPWNESIPMNPPELKRQNATVDLTQSMIFDNFVMPEEEYKLERPISPVPEQGQSPASSSPARSDESTVTHSEPVPPPPATRNTDPEDENPGNEQRLAYSYHMIVQQHINTEQVRQAFQGLSARLMQCAPGDCRAYHSVLNEWLCARLSRVAAAQMMVRYFAHDKQICYIFKEVHNKESIVRYTKSCVRSWKRKRYARFFKFGTILNNRNSEFVSFSSIT